MMSRKFSGIGLAALLLAGCGQQGEESAKDGASADVVIAPNVQTFSLLRPSTIESVRRVS